MWRYRGHCIYRSVSWFLPSCFVTVFGRRNVYLRCAYIVTYIYVFVKLHTQHNDVFIRFYFLSVWACSIGHVAQAVQRPAPGPIVPARSVWYRVQTGAVCPAFWRVCRALRGLRCIWRGLSCCLSCAARPGALGLGLPPVGYTVGAGVGWVDSLRRKNSKKAFSCIPPPLFCSKYPYPLLPISKISRKNKKTPTKGLCSVLYLFYKP